jgi:hypothetical protein
MQRENKAERKYTSLEDFNIYRVYGFQSVSVKRTEEEICPFTVVKVRLVGLKK